VGWVEVFFSLSNLTCRGRPHPPQAPTLGNLLHFGLALARPPLRSFPRINLQKLCYTAQHEVFWREYGLEVERGGQVRGVEMYVIRRVEPEQQPELLE
jgi:hypothetical protein